MSDARPEVRAHVRAMFADSDEVMQQAAIVAGYRKRAEEIVHALAERLNCVARLDAPVT